jgi:Holliday junction resolvase RusA-like endonuclease
VALSVYEAFDPEEIRVIVGGEAYGKGSKRIGRSSRTGRPIVLDVSDDRLRGYEERLTIPMRSVAPDVPWPGPIAVRIVVRVARPRAHYVARDPARPLREDAPAHPAAGRDLDKIARAILDCGTRARWWCDDRQVSLLIVRRCYGPPQTEVSARRLEDSGQAFLDDSRATNP